MKKKLLNLERKMFLNKETISPLADNEQSAVIGGDSSQCPFVATAGECSVICTVPPIGGPATNGGSICGTAVWRTFDVKTNCK